MNLQFIYPQNCPLKPLAIPQSFFKELVVDLFPVYIWKNKEKTIQSRDELSTNVVEKRLMKTSKLTFIETPKRIVINQASKTKLQQLIFVFTQEISQGKETITVQLIQIDEWSNNTRKSYQYTWNPDQGYAWQKGRQSYANSFYMTTLYEFDAPNVYNKYQTISELKYLPESVIRKLKQLTGSYYIHYMERLYNYRSTIEYLNNIGASNLAYDIPQVTNYYSTVNMNRLRPKRLRKMKQLLKNLNPNYLEYCYILDCQKHGYKIQLGIFRDFGIREQDYRTFSGYTDKSWTKFENYLVKAHKQEPRLQKRDIKVDYFDYLKQASDLGYDLNDSSYLFPKNFRKAHDRVLKETLEKEEQTNGEKLHAQNQAYQELKQEKESTWTQTIGSYIFRLPKSISELKWEGKRQHHCVGSYTERILREKTNIVFVRDVEHPDDALYTMELDNTKEHKLVQIRAKYNNSPEDKNIRTLIDQYRQLISQSA